MKIATSMIFAPPGSERPSNADGHVSGCPVCCCTTRKQVMFSKRVSNLETQNFHAFFPAPTNFFFLLCPALLKISISAITCGGDSPALMPTHRHHLETKHICYYHFMLRLGLRQYLKDQTGLVGEFFVLPYANPPVGFSRLR